MGISQEKKDPAGEKNYFPPKWLIESERQDPEISMHDPPVEYLPALRQFASNLFGLCETPMSDGEWVLSGLFMFSNHSPQQNQPDRRTSRVPLD